MSFRNVGAAPALRQSKFRIDAEQRFGAVTTFLRKQLQTADAESLVRRARMAWPRAQRLTGSRAPMLCPAFPDRVRQFVYVNAAFAPSPDELIADVARCFHVDGVLSLHYCTTPAWG